MNGGRMNCKRILRPLCLSLIAVVSSGPPASGQDGSLGIHVSLENDRVWKSEFRGLVYLAEFRNTLNEPLRFHPRPTLFSPLVYHTALCMERLDGKRYVQHHPIGFMDGSEKTEVLGVGASHFMSWDLGQVVEADANWEPIFDSDNVDYVYRGDLPLGAYEVLIRYYDRPAENAVFPERAPSEGIYLSNRVRLEVVPDGTPNVPRPEVLNAVEGPRNAANEIISHRGIRYAWTHDLAKFGIQAAPDPAGRELLLRKGSRKVRLPLAGSSWAKRGKQGPPSPAIPMIGSAGSAPRFLLPLDYVAGKLNVRVRSEPGSKAFRLLKAQSHQPSPVIASAGLGRKPPRQRR